MSIRRSSPFLLAAVAAWPGPGRGSDEASFLAEYRKHEPVLYDHYVHNRRATIEVTAYGKTEPTGVVEGRGRYQVVSRSDACRINSTVTRAGEPAPFVGGVLAVGDESYSLSRRPDGTHAIDGHVLRSTHLGDFEAMLHACRLYLPLSSSGGLRLSQQFTIMSYQKEQGGPHFEVRSVGRVTVAGKPAVKVVKTSGQNAISTASYFDPDNHYAFLRFETDGMTDSNTRKRKVAKIVGVLEYVPGPEGFQVPKEYKSWFVLPDGKRVLREEVTFIEYERYTPTDDDFDLEKQFGVKPLPKLPATVMGSTDAARRRGWWLYAGAAGLAAVTLGLVVYARRRRAPAAA